MNAPIVSFAQNAEDVVLRRAFDLGRPGFYIDVGANHPVTDSVTKLFYDAGWRGINVEPQDELLRQLVDERPRDVNLRMGVSDSSGSLTLTRIIGGDGLATFDPTLVDMYRDLGRDTVEVTVPVVTLASICEQHVDGEIDFLKIDVEGHEAGVLAGADLERFRPRVIVIEATFPERWEHLLVAARYEQTLFDGINRFYVRVEDLTTLGPALRSPATTLDDFEPYRYVAKLLDQAGQIERLVEATRSLHERIERLDAENEVLRRAWVPVPLRRLGGRVLRRLKLRRPLPA